MQKKVNTAKYARREDCNALKLNGVLNRELSQYHHGVVPAWQHVALLPCQTQQLGREVGRALTC